MTTIQLPDESAGYVKWMLEQVCADLERKTKSARRRGELNIVARPAEQYLAAALERARSELVKAYKGVNHKGGDDVAGK
jgi:hypothetical protein